MVWERVVQNAFGDPGNNKSVDATAVFNGHLYVLTGTLKSIFGDPAGKDSGGVEVWESGSGDLGAWTQVNVDGFGTWIPYPGDPGKKLYTNHVVGAVAAHQRYLYVGTKSHWGAEIWRYDGTGKTGWANVTPPWAGPGLFWGSAPTYRFEALLSFQGGLYAAEGYPSGNLVKFDGNNWQILVEGPAPFDPSNERLSSLAALQTRLYVAATGAVAPHGDQVWGFPFKTPTVDVKVNGSDGPITVAPTATVAITATLDAGEIIGQKADWYFVVWAPWGIYSLVAQGWVPGIVPFMTYPLVNLPSPVPMLNVPLPAVSYLATFAVDDRPDGNFDGTVWWDYVLITSKP